MLDHCDGHLSLRRSSHPPVAAGRAGSQSTISLAGPSPSLCWMTSPTAKGGGAFSPFGGLARAEHVRALCVVEKAGGLGKRTRGCAERARRRAVVVAVHRNAAAVSADGVLPRRRRINEYAHTLGSWTYSVPPLPPCCERQGSAGSLADSAGRPAWCSFIHSSG